MKNFATKSIGGAVFVAFLSTTALAGSYGNYGGYNNYSGGYHNDGYDNSYRKKKYYKKEESREQQPEKNTAGEAEGDREQDRPADQAEREPTEGNDIRENGSENKQASATRTRGFNNTDRNDLPLLTDTTGMTLYTFDKDKNSVSNCYSECAVSWPPYIVSANAGARENFTLVVRKDGARQWAYKGKPLYYWAGDKQSGDVRGDGVGGVWHVVRSAEFAKAEQAPKEDKTAKATRSQEEEPEKPEILTDEKKMTLYTFDNDKNGVSNCYTDCETSWPPYFVPEKAEPKEDFSIVIRKDGKQQWAYKGKPLYYWAGDQKPGDATGDGVGGVWHIIKL